MRLSQDKVKDLARQIVEAIEAHPSASLNDSATAVAVEVGSVILDDLREEDEIDAEVDELLREHAADISSQDMDVESLRLKFRRQIARERGFVL